MLLGIDIGTSSTKAVVVGEDGRVAGSGHAATPVLTPRPGWTEQEPRQWWAAACVAIRGALAEAGVDGGRIGAVGLSGQMHGSVFLERGTDKPLRPALLWNDQRTAGQLAKIESAAGGRAGLVRAVGNAAFTGFTLPKILWLREQEPAVFAKVGTVMMPKDFVRLGLTGEKATDVGDASGTLLFDPAARRWSGAMMGALGLDAAMFPPALESESAAGRVTAEAAEATGLKQGTLVVAGSGDNQVGAVGAGVVEPGMMLAIVGTSGVVYAHTESPRPDLGASGGNGAPAGRTHVFCAATGAGGWCSTGCVLSAAGSLQWLRDKLFPETGFEELLAEAWKVEPGCEGLVFLPYLQGERCPHADPAARGAFVGLTLRHGRGHLVRAVVEGVSFAMAQVMDLQRSLGVKAASVRVIGGAAKSRHWLGLLADCFGAAVEVPASEEGGALGAALLAGVGGGVWASAAEACRATIGAGTRVEPSTRAAQYARARAAYGAMYPALAPSFATLSAG